MATVKLISGQVVENVKLTDIKHVGEEGSREAITQLAAFKEEHKATNAVELIKKEVAAGNFYDEDLVVAFYLFLEEQSDEKPQMLPEDLVRKLGRDILHAVIEAPEPGSTP